MTTKTSIIILQCILLLLLGSCNRDKTYRAFTIDNARGVDITNYDTALSMKGLNCISGCKYYNMQGIAVRTIKGSLCVAVDGHRYAGKYAPGIFAMFSDHDTVWTLPIEAHHEILLDEDSNIVVLSREHMDFNNRRNLSVEVLYTITQQGKVIGRQSFTDLYGQLQKFLPISPDSIVSNNRKVAGQFPYHASAFFDTSLFHINSVQILPPNALEKTDSTFAHGNFLISDFLNNFVAIVGRKDFRIRWLYYQSESCMGQHAARMLPDGRMMFFVNNLHNSAGHLYSAVRIIDPVSKNTVWEYSGTPPESLQSVTQGYCQYLGNGNILITINNYVVGGKRYVLEVTPDKKIVWEWHPHLLDNSSPLEDFYRVDRVAF